MDTIISRVYVNKIADLATAMLDGRDTVCERSAWKRFKNTEVFGTMDERNAAAVFEAIYGDAPTYIRHQGTGMNAIYAPDVRDKVMNYVYDAAMSLSSDPTSVHDLCGKFNYFYAADCAHYPTATNEHFMRKLFDKAADLGIIKRMRIKTCGRTHINLYYI